MGSVTSGFLSLLLGGSRAVTAAPCKGARGRESKAVTLFNASFTEAFQVVPGTLEVSTTSIKLNWTCSLPDACQRMQATCRLAGPSSPPCEAEEVTAQEMLYGQNGTFTCNHLQPFTDYSVTISVPPSTIVFTWVIRTKETGGCPQGSTREEGHSWTVSHVGESDKCLLRPAADPEHPLPTGTRSRGHPAAGSAPGGRPCV